MYRDAVFSIAIYPDLYYDILYRSWCLPVFLRSVFLRLHARFLGVSNTRLSPDAFSQDSLSKVFNVDTSQLEGEWYSVLLGSTQLSLLVSTRWEPGSFPFCRPVGNLEFSRYVYGPLSRYEGE